MSACLRIHNIILEPGGQLRQQRREAWQDTEIPAGSGNPVGRRTTSSGSVPFRFL